MTFKNMTGKILKNLKPTITLIFNYFDYLDDCFLKNRVH